MKSLAIFLFCFTLTLAKDGSVQELTSANNLFTASVYKEISKSHNSNFLVCPFSAETILALTQSGAKDETAQEIRTCLHLPDSQEKIEEAFKTLQPGLKSDKDFTFQTANKIYVKDNFELRDEFKKVAAEVFDADLENIDFGKNVDAAQTMNVWVEKKTENKIHELIDSGSLDDLTRAILINALYFQANWSEPFVLQLTGKREFHKSASEIVEVDMMYDVNSIRDYYESAELKAKFLELPFEGENVSMTIVLPNEKEGLAALEENIDKVLVSPVYSSELVRVALPKFKIESKLDFKKLLKKLGVTKAFKDDEADLSGIAGEKGDLVINEAVQKTFIDVNEKGVEAAAATFVNVGVPYSGIASFKPPKEFIADHPFIFFIKINNLIVFAGRVVAPDQ